MLSVAFLYSAIAHGVEAVLLALVGVVLLVGLLKRVGSWRQGAHRAPPQALYGGIGASRQRTLPGPPANP